MEVRTIGANGGPGAATRLEVRLEVPKLREFRGERNAKKIDNFL